MNKSTNDKLWTDNRDICRSEEANTIKRQAINVLPKKKQNKQKTKKRQKTKRQ